MLTRREVAQLLDITPEMAVRNGIPARMTEADATRIDAEPPPWLAQSRTNRTGSKPVWVQLTCAVCGRSDTVRPKKWWPAFTCVSCDHHSPDDLPETAPGFVRAEYPGIGAGLVGIFDDDGTLPSVAAAQRPSTDR